MDNMIRRMVRCPFCDSEKIVQDLKIEIDIVTGDGSHCDDCGTKFARNTAHLEGEIEKFKNIVEEAKKKQLKEQL